MDLVGAILSAVAAEGLREGLGRLKSMLGELLAETSPFFFGESAADRRSPLVHVVLPRFCPYSYNQTVKQSNIIEMYVPSTGDCGGQRVSIWSDLHSKDDLDAADALLGAIPVPGFRTEHLSPDELLQVQPSEAADSDCFHRESAKQSSRREAAWGHRSHLLGSLRSGP